MRLLGIVRVWLGGLLVAVLCAGLLTAESSATEKADVPAQNQPSLTANERHGLSVPFEDRGNLLGPDWKMSKDRAWTTTGDADGFHFLVADQKNGYTWRVAASLSEPGFDADAWIGNACVTGSGKLAVVVYAPRTFTNKPRLMARGGFTAVVHLGTGKVTKLGLNASLSYYSPGCGLGESVIFTQSGGDDKTATRLIWLDAATGKREAPVVVPGQVTSAIPVRGKIVAADAGRLVTIGRNGKRTTAAETRAVPYSLTADRTGGVVFLDRKGDDRSEVKRVTAAQLGSADQMSVRPSALAVGPLTDLGLARAATTGTVFVTGKVDKRSGAVPPSVRVLEGIPASARISTGGEAVLTETAWADGKDSRVARPDPAAARPVNVDMWLLDSGRRTSFTVTPDAVPSSHAEQGRDPQPLPRSSANVGGGSRTVMGGSRDELVENERVCSVPRNDPRNQAMQPKPRQIEWAVDQAIMGTLNKNTDRPADWKHLGMPAYEPQDLFPRPTLEGGGRVPAQILLGVAAQESNMWQAARFAVPGVTANPLIGNYYGIDYYDGDSGNDWDIDWAGADCGYGVMQVTDHMRRAGHEAPGSPPAWPYNTQRAVALDYATNIAAGLQILAEKWNQTRRAGMKVNNGDWAKLENWFFALWAYNSGFYPDKGDSSPWGVGWHNNPANPEWKAGRSPFLSSGYKDAATPQYWPYQEKVLGWAAYPIEAVESPGTIVHGYRPAWWTSEADRINVKPAEGLFCTSANDCDPGKISEGASNDPGAGPCQRSDFHCWWHKSVAWKGNCEQTCGNEFVRFNSTYKEEADGTAYPPNCGLSGLPSGARIIDNLPTSTPSVRPGCSKSWSDAGSFSMDFGDGEAMPGSNLTVWPGKVDTHQIGAGFGGHFYISNTREGAKGDRLKATGTWRLSSALDKWGRLLVHLPDHGAHTQQAHYEIYRGSSLVGERYVPTRHRRNSWVNLGVFDFRGAGVPSVKLSTVTDDGTGDERIAWDAVAFVPLSAKPKEFVVAMGDSYSSGEGAGDYSTVSNNDYGESSWNACRRSDHAWSRKTTLPGFSASVGTLADAHDSSLDFQFVACSGARTWQMTAGDPTEWGYDGNFREKTQIDSGVLDENTTLVTLTVGGNDAGFPRVIQACAVSGCPPSGEMKHDIDTAMVDVEQTLRDIHFAAINAEIVLLGYPQLFNESDSSCVSGVGGSGMITLNEMSRYMSDKQAALARSLSASGIPVKYESPDADFEGKRACDDPEGIHKIVTAPEGEGDFDCKLGGNWCVSRESYHPTEVGTSAYAAAFRRALGRP